MKHKLVIISYDGSETFFDTNCNVNFDRERLLLTVKTSSAVYGWHWDRFVSVIQHPGMIKVGKAGEQICDIALRLESGEEKMVRIDHFHSVELQAVNRILVVKGQQESALVNMDYLKWYHVHI